MFIPVMDDRSARSSTYVGPQAPSGGRPRSADSTGDGSAHDVQSESPAESIRHAGNLLAELKSYATNYLAAKSDALKLSIKRGMIFAGLGIIGLIAAGGMLVTAVVLLLMGIANGIGKLFDPDQPWVGQLVVGVLVLGGTGLGAWLMLRKITNRSREQTVAKYEQRHNEQRRQFGHDARQRADKQA